MWMSLVTHVNASFIGIHESRHTCEKVLCTYVHVVLWRIYTNQGPFTASLYIYEVYVHIWKYIYVWLLHIYEYICVTHIILTRHATHVWIGHVTRMNESCMNESCHTYEWVVSHKWMSHVTHMNELCYTCERVMSHIWIGHVTHAHESCHTYVWVTSRICMSHVTHMNGSRYTCVWVMSHIWMGPCTHMYESRHTYESFMSHMWMSHVTHMNGSRYTYAWVMSHIITHMNGSRYTHAWVMSHIWMGHGIHPIPLAGTFVFGPQWVIFQKLAAKLDSKVRWSRVVSDDKTHNTGLFCVSQKRPVLC